MFEQFDLIEIYIGAAGLLLVLNGLLTMFFPKYYGYFSKTFFIERVSDVGKQRLNEQIKNDHYKSRYAISAFIIFFGLTAIAWALGLKWAIGLPFSLFI